jgi:hypothetical protein
MTEVQRRVDPVAKQIFMWDVLATAAEMNGVDASDKQKVITYAANAGLIRAHESQRGKVVLTLKGVALVHAAAKMVQEQAAGGAK